MGGAVALGAGLGIGRFAYTPILPEMMAALKMSAASAGAIASANLIGYLIGAIAAMSSRISGPKKLWLLGALCANAIALILMGLVPEFNSQLAIRFLNGVASAFVFVFALDMVLADAPPSSHQKLSAIHFSGVGAGIVISAVVIGVLLQRNYSWSMLWFACGGLSILAIIFVALTNRNSSTAANITTAVPTEAKSSARGLIIAAYGFFGFGYIITATFLIALVRQSTALMQIEPWLWVVFGLSAMPSVAFWNGVAKSRGVYLAFAIACIVEAIGVLASILSPTPIGLVSSAFLLGGTFAGVTALGMAAIRAIPTTSPRREIAAMTVSFGVGQVAGPIFAGYTADISGSFVLATIAGAVALLISAGLVLAARA